MRVIALLSWYDERPEQLAEMIDSLQGFADGLVAVDGAYALYPNGQPCSPHEQQVEIMRVARQVGLPAIVHQPGKLWAGNQVEKRSFLFRLADTVAEANEDWYLVIDADEVLESVPADAKARLQASARDAAEVSVLDKGVGPQPRLVRAIPGLRAVGLHWRYFTPDGRCLWGYLGKDEVEPFEPMGDLEIGHHRERRLPERRARASAYYEAARAQHVEVL